MKTQLMVTMRKSSWQQKYGGDKQQDHAADDDNSLHDWISAVQERANNEASTAAALSETYYEEIVPDSVPADNEAAAIIHKMNQLLDDGFSTASDNNNTDAFDFNEVDFHADTASNINDEQLQMDFNEEDYSKYLQLSSIEEDPVFGSSELTIDIRDEVAVLFRRTNDAKMLKKCFDILVVHAEDSKLLRARVFACWKLITRRSTNSKDQLVRRFRRRSRLRCLRRMLTSWLSITAEKNILLQRAIERRDWRTKSKVFAILHTRYKHVQKLNGIADKFYQSRLKRQLFVGWLASKKTVKSTSPSNTKSTSHLVDEGQGDYKARAAIEDDHEEDVDPSKLSATKCITPEKKVAQLSQPRSQASEKENKQPNNKEGRQLLQPLKPQRKPLRNTGTPKLIKDMHLRKKERERQREILRQRYEQKAIERKNQLRQEQLRREEIELRVQREYIENKAAEEHKKQIAAARYKQANRLAVLHYRLSLQRRLLLQWTKIFKIKSFNERKAIMAWRDTLLEKCWQSWIIYTAEEQAKRKALELKNEISADVFNRRRLLAKSFASLEEHCHYTQSLIQEAQQKFATHKQRLIINKWLRVTVKALKTRRKREKKAAKHGRRILLLRVMQYWQVGVQICKKEHEVDMLVKAKWEEVEKWLE